MGLSYGKTCTLVACLFDIQVTRGGLALALQRLGRAAAPTYEALKDTVSRADVVTPDETGWRIAGRAAWLWVFVTTKVTVYAIETGRGFLEAAKVLGEGFAGTLARDGWAPYRKFVKAKHQTCVAHLLRRCKEILATAQRGAARLPHGVRRILKEALVLRDQRDAGTISADAFGAEKTRLRAAMDRFLKWRPRNDQNRKLVKHLNNESGALFTFLDDPAVPATNHHAERALRPAVITRKTCGGGNREWSGARATSILLTIFRTAWQQGRDPLLILADLLRQPLPTVADILLPPLPRPPSTPDPGATDPPFTTSPEAKLST
jgi:transposase